MISNSDKRVLFIIGPTASGKTRLSLQLTKKCKAEIVSADSRQVYRYMDIGTDKPAASERKKVPHHCIDIRDPDDYFSAGEYGKLAREIISEIFSRSRLSIVVGGSGLYIRALADGVFAGNYRDASVREKLKRRATEEGLEALYRRLSEIDPDAVKKIHPNDKRRIIRALEVYEISGQPISRIQATKTEPADFLPVFWGLRWPREVIYRRIEERVDQMVDSGLVQEVKKLLDMGYGFQNNSLHSVGYKEVVDHLEGHTTLQEAIHLIKQNTRRFAKKQLTWFRRDDRIQWIDVQEPVDWSALADTVLASLNLEDSLLKSTSEA
jgi:tRNA dimethylallyltransferase